MTTRRFGLPLAASCLAFFVGCTDAAVPTSAARQEPGRTEQAVSLAGWSVGRRYLVTHTASGAQNLTDFQVRFVIDTATEIAAGRMRADCGDLRVYDGDGCTPTNAVPFWVADGTCNTATTNVWLRLPQVSAGTSTPLAMFWGNASATSLSDGASVFPTFFDDFNAPGSSFDSAKWATYGPVFRSGGYATTSGGAAGFWSTNKVLAAGQTVFGVRTDAQSASGADIEYGAATLLAPGPTGSEMHWSARRFSGVTWMSYDYSFTTVGAVTTGGSCQTINNVAPRWANPPGTTTFFQTEFFYEKNPDSTVAFGIYDKNGTKLQVTMGSPTCTANLTESAYWQFDHSGAAPNPISRVDYAYVRKYANPDPVIVATGIDIGPSSCLQLGEGPCTTANEASVCQTVNCSAAGICIPNRADACYVDADCAISSYCERSTWTCRTKLASGTALPQDGLHDTCPSDTAVNASCASGQCNVTTQTCGSVNGVACTQASGCVSNACSPNANTCMPLGGCAVAADCGAGATCSSGACVVYPGIDASPGTTTFDALAGDVAIDPSLTVVGSAPISGATVTIGTGFVSAQDRLVFTNANGISGSYSTATGILTLSGSATSADYQAALRSVKYSNLAGALPTTALRSITFAIGNAVANGSNGHFYEYVSYSGTWTSARNNAATRSYLGLQGYLATLTTAAENDFVRQKLTNDGWIGAQSNPETTFPRTWYWVTGPEAGAAMCSNPSAGTCSSINGAFSNWASGEPNNAGGEGCGQIYFANSGRWNDLPCNATILPGYLVEYGGTASDPVLTLTDTKPLQVRARPTITVGASQTSPPVGTSITFTATVNPSASTGAVQFVIDGQPFGSTVSLVSGVASISTSALGVGAHTISVTYPGDTERQAGSGALSGGVTVTTIPNGQGPCTAGNQATVCTSGLCNVTTGTCAAATGASCTTGSQCVTNVCGSNGQCGVATGGACTSSADCQTGACSPNAHTCMPSGGCAVTADCAAGQQCNGALQCEVAPGIDATAGVTTYDALGSEVVVDPAITVVGAQDLSSATVSIGAGFVASQDQLRFVDGNGIAGTYNASTGILMLSGSASSAAYQAALRTVTYANSAGAFPATAPRTITFAIGSAVANGTNGHFYEYVSYTGTWSQARVNAATRTYLGLQGYLATLTSAAENDFVRQKLTNDGWIGAQSNPETTYPRTWYWVTGPEAGTAMCSNPSSGTCTAIAGAYSNWASGEPNNSGGEGCGQIYFANSGRWNDLRCSSGTLPGYLVEYGGSTNDPVLTLSDTKPLQVRAKTSLVVTSSQASAPLQTNLTFTVSLTPAEATGTVLFTIDGQPFGGPVAIVGGVASISLDSLALGAHTIDVTYAGDTERLPASGEVSGGVTITTIPNGQGACSPATAATDCTSGVCSSAGTCGYQDNEGSCSPGASSLCQSGVCSAGGVCMPAAPGSCYVDVDCAAGTYCDRASNTCVPTLSSGAAIPSDGLHDGSCTGGISAVCQTGACNVATGTCAGAEGASCSAATQCVSNACAPSGACVPSSPGSCWADGDCAGSEYCNRAAFTCVARLPSGSPIPVDGLHTGLCTAGAPTCASGRCNAATQTCASAVGEGCGSASECEFNTCSQGTCGFSNGESGCTAQTAYLCQSGACSASGACIPPGANGCFLDSDCDAAQFCDRAHYVCVSKGLSGAPLPNDGLHDGVCTSSLAAATCATGACNAVTNSCADANGASCTTAGECVTNVCGGDQQCGHAAGEGPCTAQNAATVCRSGFCNAAANGTSSACVPGASSCWVDADCGAAEYCARDSFTCTPKLGPGASLPSDGLHDACVGDVNAACTSGLCNATTGTCAQANEAPCASAAECVTNACGSNGACGLADGEAGCSAQTGATLCQSGACTPSNVCAQPGGCFIDSDCLGTQYCDRASLTCHGKLLSGTAIPDDGLHTGACDALGSATCASGACNAVTNTCAAGKSVACATDSQCVSNQCGANQRCDLADGEAGCTVADPSACQSVTCSVEGVCVPAQSGSCWVDADCAAAQHCRRDQFVCVPDGLAGEALVADTLHEGVCSSAAAIAVCATGACNPATNTCAASNGTACTVAAQCVVDVCGANGHCGFADGQEGCTAATATRCQSETCSTSNTCMPATGCWVDADCAQGRYCDRGTTTCRAQLGSGTALPSDGLHDGLCTEASAAALCASGTCNATSNTCAVVNSEGCSRDEECQSNVCGPDGQCGAPDGAACTSDAVCRNGCVEGVCANSDPGQLTGGSGCSSTGSGGWSLLAVAALLLLRRSRRLVGVAGAVMLVAALPARAQSSSSAVSQGAAVDTFRGAAPGSDWFSTDSLDFRGTVRPSARVLANWGHALLVVRNGDGSVRSTPVENQLWFNVGAGVTLFDRVRVFANVPVAAVQSGQTANYGGQPLSAGSAGVGDLGFGADVRLFGEYGAPISLAVGATMTAPTGAASQMLGDGVASVQPRVMAAGQVGLFVWAAQVGFNVRGASIGSINFGHEVRFAASAGVKLLGERLLVGPEFFAVAPVTTSGTSRRFGLEGDLGAHFALTPQWRVGAGVGTGLVNAAGVPDVRALASVDWAMGVPARRAADADGDGVADVDDRCPGERGDAAHGGCAAARDTDHDGIADAEDLCPLDSALGARDLSRRGCPVPPDADGDGVPDADDACRDEAPVGPMNPKAPGCPDRDVDGDGVLESRDVCPAEAAGAMPDPSRPGCPLPDADGDGIADAVDHCPSEQGVPMSESDKSGCPGLLRLEADRLLTNEPVFFAPGTAVILPRSLPVLEAVRSSLLAMGSVKVVVEGHTDAQGLVAANQKLSEQRAEAVKKWLVDHGVDASRLDARGYGMSRLLVVDERTAADRQTNRRVEFRLER